MGAPEFSLIKRAKGGSTLEPCGYDAGKKIFGRKRHLLTNTIGVLLAVFVHPGNVQGRNGAELLLHQARIARRSGGGSTLSPAYALQLGTRIRRP